MNKTVLSDENLEATARRNGTGGWQTLESMKLFAREVEQAVLQSPEIQQLRKEAEVCKAIELACEKLPLDCDIRIELERDAGTVVLFVDGDRVDFPSDHESMDMAIRDAIDAAMEVKP